MIPCTKYTTHHTTPHPIHHTPHRTAPNTSHTTPRRVVEKAEGLVGPHIRHMVVATDDPAWLSREIATVRAGGQAPGWSFHFVQAPLSDNPSDNPSPELSYLHQRTGGVAAGAFFFAQMQALSQCEGLVAHFGSGVAYEVYAMMCFQHGALGPSAGAEAVYGVCPSIFDWRADKSRMIG
eukprot:CAMPEP_0173288174 /NCGR_PEP_ID=MMETSP1143-20121109/10257_1 /TAXON_ID=483371 /ORGANISM="non described non described, Strain CCMP2298" /LENGTH=178 /DNA_ID=CAMNT_0014226883 /DNA_START=551 /DNA_END=1090 /DNA_ORIENTATION=-